jgi:hypothetical protein
MLYPLFSAVNRGLDPRVHQSKNLLRWIAGSNPAMTI